MAASTPPHTPTRSRLAPTLQTTTPAPRSPAALRTAGRQAQASPQVKAAIAALRAQRSSNASGKEDGSTPSPSTSDPFSTPPPAARARSRTSQLSFIAAGPAGTSSPGVGRSIARIPNGDSVLLDWGGLSEAAALRAGGRSGKLHLASRSLTAVPEKVYSTLMALSSPYHPSHHQRPAPALGAMNGKGKGSAVVLGAAGSKEYEDDEAEHEDVEEEEDEPLALDEQQELTVINLGNNEIAELEEEIGGFEELEVLDLRSNLLSSLPSSLSLLTCLTILNLSHNRLTSFPVPLLALRSLVKLDLSHNRLSALWSGADWREELQELLKGVKFGQSPSRTPEASNPPRDRGPPSTLPFNSSTAPLPSLTTLLLSHNPLSATSLTEALSLLPPKLVTLDLSYTPLGRGRGEGLPLELLGRLPRLEKLLLEGVGAGDAFWSNPGAEKQAGKARGELFLALKHLALGGNSLQSLETLEDLLRNRTRAKVQWEGVEKAVKNLIGAEERLLQVEGNDGQDQGNRRREISVDLLGNPLSLERERRRARFPDRQAVAATTTSSSAATTPAVSPPSQPQSTLPSPPTPLSTTHSVSTSARIPEPWEREALSGLSTPLGRRKAAAEEARRLAREEEEEEMRRGMEKLRLEQTHQRTASAEEQEGEAPPPPYVAAAESSETKEEVPKDSTTESSAPGTPAPAPITESQSTAETEPDPAVTFLLSHFTPSSSAPPLIALPSLALTSLPSPSSPPPPHLRSVTALDLSRNALLSLPLRALDAWCWSTGLTKLNLSRNKLGAEAFLELGDGEGSTLPSLRELNLSWNALPSVVGERTATLRVVRGLAPRLEVLNVDYNKLTSLEGVEDLVLSSSGGGTAGVKQLVMRGNKITDVEALCAIGQTLDSEGSGAERGRGRWTVELLDLRDNDIARLPPTLGLLPHSLELDLLGNRFRVPRVDVYENAGQKRVLPWLKERLG